MQVKDRFCTLLSQQVSQLQNRLASLNFETQDGEGSTTTAQPQQEVREIKREKWEERETRVSIPYIISCIAPHIIDPLPPPNDVQLTHVTSNQLTFNWNSVQPDCSTLQYRIESNCGTCVNQQPTMFMSSATCSFELPINSNDVCNFAVQSTICANSIIGSLSTPVRVTLKRKLTIINALLCLMIYYNCSS